MNAPQWADGATMERFAALTGLERVEQKPQLNAGGAWSFPNGSVMVQTLSLDLADDAGKPARKRVETRLLVRQQGEWTGYSYRWNAEQTDAELVPAAGAAAELEVADPTAPGGLREQVWRFPGRTECLVCHSRASGFVLGFSPLQLDRDRDYGGIVDNQLRTLEHIGVFQGKLPQRPDDRKRLVNPYEDGAPLEARVKSYLHVNCSTCHVGEGGGNASMELGFTTPLAKMKHHRRGPDPRPLRHRRRPPGRPRLARAFRPLPADLATGDRPDAPPGLHRGRPQGPRADLRLDSRPARGEVIGPGRSGGSSRVSTDARPTPKGS